MLITQVKVGKITNLSEARYCAGMGVDFLSFPISSIDPKTFKEITGWVAGPALGIEIDSARHEKYAADFIEVTSDSLDLIEPEEKAFVGLHATDWAEMKNKINPVRKNIIAIELYVPSPNDSQNLIEEISKMCPVFLKVASNTNLESALKLPIHGISLEGNAETSPGLKEYPLSAILEKLEVVD